MKKIITLALLSITICTNAQMTGKLIQGTIKPGNTKNSIKAVLRSSATFRGQFSNVQFTFQIPNSVVPQPTVTIKNNPLSDYISTGDYKMLVTNEGGYYNYLFAAVALNSAVYNFVSGSEIDALEVEINSTSEKNIPVKLASLANGGSIGQLNFYIEISGNDNTNVTSMFYGPSVSNKGSYTNYSYVPLQIAISETTAVVNSILVYPTLSHGTVNVKLPEAYQNARIRIIDTAGKEVGYDESNTLNRTLSFKKLANGFYTVRVTDNNKIINNVKIILQQ